MNRTRVKICGITSPDDALLAVNAGTDAIGMVFYERSPRHVDTKVALDIAKSLPAFVMSVGLFVDADENSVRSILNRVPLQLLQFHGDESPDYCEQFEIPYIKALRVGLENGGLNGDNLRKRIDSYGGSCGILLDTYQQGTPGGTGECFDWDLIPEASQKIILAGGLKPGNVAEAIASVNPYAVDVSGGVESAPGIKDPVRIRAFLEAVHSAGH